MSTAESRRNSSSRHVQSAAYRELRGLVEAGALDLHLIISPPRTLSTILGKSLAEASSVNLWINEPTSKFGCGEGRVEESYKTILTGVHQTSASKDGVKRVLLSIISSTVGPDQEASDLFDIAKTISFSLRNPVLSLESMILLLGKIVQAVGKAPDCKRALLKDGWIAPGTRLDHIAEDDLEPWASHLGYCAEHRDYRSLTARFMYVANGIAASPAFRLEAWSDPTWVALVHGGDLRNLAQPRNADAAWRARIESHAKLDFDRLTAVAPDLAEVLAYLQGGWLFLRRLFDRAIRHCPEKLVAILDATELQLKPEASLARLRDAMGLGPAEQRHTALKTGDGYGEQYATTDLTAETLFGRALASERIALPDRVPLKLKAFPVFSQRHLRTDFLSYLSLRAARHLTLPLFQDLASLLEARCADGKALWRLDPVFGYLCCAQEAAPADIRSFRYRRCFRDERSEYAAYYDLIDAVLRQTSFALPGSGAACLELLQPDQDLRLGYREHACARAA